MPSCREIETDLLKCSDDVMSMGEDKVEALFEMTNKVYKKAGEEVSKLVNHNTMSITYALAAYVKEVFDGIAEKDALTAQKTLSALIMYLTIMHNDSFVAPLNETPEPGEMQ